MTTVNTNLFHKFQSVKQISARQKADGNEVEVEVREDEEQSVKLQEIIDLLVAAGYFRARIKGLSPFDKVVGGMTWCIESCNIDVDVDLLFQENSTIGQKIALTEKIVAVLPKMKCPHRIEPHQIQGLDFIHIFPVIQWLVKRSMEFRQEMSAFVTTYAVSQFNKEFPLKNKKLEAQKQILKNVSVIKEAYRPMRCYRRKNAPPDDIQSRVQITLLEYGRHGDIRCTTPNKSDEDMEEQQSVELDVQRLMSDMTLMKEEFMDDIALNEEERQELAKHYAVLQSEIEDGGIKSREQKKLLLLEQQANIIQERCKKLATNNVETKELIAKTSEVLLDTRAKQQEAEKTLQQFEETKMKDPETVKEIEELVILNDSLRSQEIQFREHCKQELSRLQKMIEETKNAKSPAESTPEIQKDLEEESEKLRLLRLQVAKKNRSIALLQRKLDDVPSRAELAQYQRRFLELYNQVAAKHKETKQYYTLYNTLEDTRGYISKELSLLNSISDSYPEAMSSNSGKEEFLKQFENIVDSVKQSKLKLERKLGEEKHQRDKLSNVLQGLLEQQRRYVAALRQLSVECRKQEMLLAQRKS